MEQRLHAMVDILGRYGCGPTLPITGAVAKRNLRLVTDYNALGIEFAVHGYYHVDHVRLSDMEQLNQLKAARRLLEEAGVPVGGFRAPYLRWNEATLQAVRETGFLYDASQAMNWPIDPELETEAYRRSLAFYDATCVSETPALPWLDDGVIRIPYSLPDDEAIVDRLRLPSHAIKELWLSMLHGCHRRGQLFTLGLHPERIEACAGGVKAVLEAARAARPHVWVAHLRDVARWWRDRAATTVTVGEDASGRLHISVRGPEDLAVLARGLELPGAEPWSGDYVLVRDPEFDLRAHPRPLIGIHPSSPISLTGFLRENGYIVETSESPDSYHLFLKRDRFLPRDRRPLLSELDAGGFPLLRLGTWPGGARSALCITGDVDALTLKDYLFRVLGR
jgi:hypothetical protein